MNPTLPIYEVYAMRYATHQARHRHENFISSDVHDGPMPLDYFVWVIRGNDKTYLVDTGFSAETANIRQRPFLRCPVRSWANVGIETTQFSDVIFTHMHYDHAGNLDLLPKARLHLQEQELQYVTGRYMQYKVLRNTYAVDDVVNVVRRLYDSRVQFHLGDDELAAGIQLIQVGGHTAGLQAVRVHTQRGWIVLASDASHFYENIFRESPFPIVLHVGEMLEGYHKLLRLCESHDHLIPGHDPLVLHRYPTWGDPAHEIVALHQPPIEELDLGINR
jgi:glyoxylase-like metal-dependent hydrolase (beta-lactamase superfamily II)